MTIDQLKAKFAELEKALKIEKAKLCTEYAKANAAAKIGDVLEDHIGKIRVQKIGYHWGFLAMVEVTYEGEILNKDNSPSKKGGTRTIYHSNIKK